MFPVSGVGCGRGCPFVCVGGVSGFVRDRQPSHRGRAFFGCTRFVRIVRWGIRRACWGGERGWDVGGTLAVTGPPGETVEATLGGSFLGSDILQSFAVSGQTAAATGARGSGRVLIIGVNNDGTVDQAQLRANLEAAVRHDIVVQVRSTEDMTGEVAALIDQMLFILYALLSLAVVIAVLGIVNTLTLSVIERRQEIGMLRAVGTQRRQIRAMITLGSV